MKTRWSIGAAALCSLFAASCGTDVFGPDVDHVVVSLTLSKSEIVLGDTVELRVVGTNPTQRTLRFVTHACAAFSVRILHGTDFVVFQHPRVCDSIGAERVLEPGTSIEETVLFDGTGSAGPFRDENGDRVTVTLAPGVYTVVAAPEGVPGNRSNAVDLRIWPRP
jgi:hypothetical protein